MEEKNLIDETLSNLFYISFILKIKNDIGIKTPIWIDLKDDFKLNSNFNFEEININGENRIILILDSIIINQNNIISIITYKKPLSNKYSEEYKLSQIKNFNLHSDELFKRNLIKDILTDYKNNNKQMTIEKYVLDEQKFTELVNSIYSIKKEIKEEEKNKRKISRINTI
jgi:hypothetical protein